MKKCLVEVWNSQINKSEWLQGKIVGEQTRLDLDEMGINVRISDGRVFEGCHPVCVKII